MPSNWDLEQLNPKTETSCGMKDECEIRFSYYILFIFVVNSAKEISAFFTRNFLSSINKAYDQDDWDSDFEDEDASVQGGHVAQSGMTGSNLMPPKNTVHSGSSGDLSSVGRKSSVAASSSVTSKTSFNRFSTFVKSGGENYILGKLNAKVQEADIIQVVVSLLNGTIKLRNY